LDARWVGLRHRAPPSGAGTGCPASRGSYGGYLDLRDSDLETLVLLLHAAESAYGRLKREGAQGGANPAFAEGLLTQLQQLRDLLHAEHKARMAKR
jgi:hypothetical protein